MMVMMMMDRSEAVLTMMSNAASVSLADIENSGINLNQRWPNLMWCRVNFVLYLSSVEYEYRYEVTDNAIETIKEWRSPSGEKIFQSKLRFQIRFQNSFIAILRLDSHGMKFNVDSTYF